MNPFQEKFDKKYFGMYRAKIIEVNEDVKNGIYKVRTFPVTSDIEDQYLPYAQSNMTVNDKHINLKVDDFVWVFFENGNPEYPVIFDRCNIKDKYPDASTGNEPTYYNDITSDTAIDENTVTYGGTYNKVSSFDFGENIHIEIDEENEQILFMTSKHQLIFDTDENGHIKLNSLFIKTSEKCNINSNSNKIKIDDQGINIEDKNSNKLELTSTGIKATDANNNVIETSLTGVTVTDLSTNEFKTALTGITIKDSLGNEIITQVGSVEINKKFKVNT